MKLIFNGEEMECTKAIKGTDFIQVFDGENLIAEFSGISNFNGYELQDGNGNIVGYELPQATQSERLNAIEMAQSEVIRILSEVV